MDNRMSGEFSFKLNDDAVDSLRYLVECSKKNETDKYVQVAYTNDKVKKFKLDKVRYNPKFYKRKVGKRYKYFIKPSNEYFFEGVCVNG